MEQNTYDSQERCSTALYHSVVPLVRSICESSIITCGEPHVSNINHRERWDINTNHQQFHPVPCQCPSSPVCGTFCCFSPTRPTSSFVPPPGTRQTQIWDWAGIKNEYKNYGFFFYKMRSTIRTLSYLSLKTGLIVLLFTCVLLRCLQLWSGSKYRRT